ncbi:MAG: type II toxin-antitoxin system VapC family toxin [Pseudomonadota bacterium]|nr:type II toxin-antitoxin system VapC family toxin [Pseudomonadota bacterium]
MAYLFDTDALSEVMRRQPNALYLEWLRGIPREEQFTSAVSIGELFQGAYRSEKRAVLIGRIEEWVLPAVTVLPFDLGSARVFGELQADLESRGLSPGDADVQIAATAIRHGLALVTGKLRHHQRVPGLRIATMLADARRASLGSV